MYLDIRCMTLVIWRIKCYDEYHVRKNYEFFTKCIFERYGVCIKYVTLTFLLFDLKLITYKLIITRKCDSLY